MTEKGMTASIPTESRKTSDKHFLMFDKRSKKPEPT